ncbi:MAG: hypothetical protein L0216_04360 [Planctomycetales bacterium]|nr:hypothetical protein [Planctomycetales bacterium]
MSRVVASSLLLLLAAPACRGAADLHAELDPWVARAVVAAEREAALAGEDTLVLAGRLDKITRFLEDLADPYYDRAAAWFRLAAADATEALGAERGTWEDRTDVADALDESAGGEDRLAAAALLVQCARWEERSGIATPSRHRSKAAVLIARSGSPRAPELLEALDRETSDLLADAPRGLAQWKRLMGALDR